MRNMIHPFQASWKSLCQNQREGCVAIVTRAGTRSQVAGTAAYDNDHVSSMVFRAWCFDMHHLQSTLQCVDMGVCVWARGWACGHVRLRVLVHLRVRVCVDMSLYKHVCVCVCVRLPLRLRVRVRVSMYGWVCQCVLRARASS